MQLGVSACICIVTVLVLLTEPGTVSSVIGLVVAMRNKMQKKTPLQVAKTLRQAPGDGAGESKAYSPVTDEDFKFNDWSVVSKSLTALMNSKVGGVLSAVEMDTLLQDARHVWSWAGDTLGKVTNFER